VTVEDQQTVVIGGLTKEEQTTSDEKVPVLGDIPILGFLFRHQTTDKKRSNLMIVLTPYIVRDQTDLRKIFERKMQERQEFLDRYFVFNGRDWTPPKDYARSNGLVEDIRQSFFKVEEQIRLLKESEPVKREHQPGEAIDLPEVPAAGTSVAATSGAPAAATAPAPTAPAAAPAPAAPAAPTPGATPPTQPTKPTTPRKRQPVRRPGAQPRTELETPVVVRPMVRNVNTEY
jgi:general secretion pathway protein D